MSGCEEVMRWKLRSSGRAPSLTLETRQEQLKVKQAEIYLMINRLACAFQLNWHNETVLNAWVYVQSCRKLDRKVRQLTT